MFMPYSMLYSASDKKKYWIFEDIFSTQAALCARDAIYTTSVVLFLFTLIHPEQHNAYILSYGSCFKGITIRIFNAISNYSPYLALSLFIFYGKWFTHTEMYNNKKINKFRYYYIIPSYCTRLLFSLTLFRLSLP